MRRTVLFASRFIISERLMKQRPSLSAVFTNLDAPIPLPRKLWLLTRNVSLRLIKRQDCCGHHGEPGC
jgi:hypothetical protein